MDSTLGARSRPSHLTSRWPNARLAFLALLAAAALAALSTPASADPQPQGAASGVIRVRFDDNVTGQPLSAQYIDIDATQVCDGSLDDEVPDAGEIGATRPFGSYIVGYNNVNQPAQRLVKPPTAVGCELTAQTPLCDLVFSFNPVQPIPPPSYPKPVNLFLTDQGGNVSPSICDAATDVLTLSYGPASVPPTPVGGFELEVRFDPALVCVDIEAGAYFHETPQSVCFVQDMGGPETPGSERLGCTVLGDPETTSSSIEMMVVHVRAQPAQYLSIVASQDNGVNARVLAQDCNAADFDGQLLPILACQDYEITIRRLEGDVNGDCAVDIRDAQLLAYRWGEYRILWLEDLRFDLVPPGGDGKINIRDVQYVHGRNGSTCATPLPSQPPRSSYLE